MSKKGVLGTSRAFIVDIKVNFGLVSVKAVLPQTIFVVHCTDIARCVDRVHRHCKVCSAFFAFFP